MKDKESKDDKPEQLPEVDKPASLKRKGTLAERLRARVDTLSSRSRTESKAKLPKIRKETSVVRKEKVSDVDLVLWERLNAALAKTRFGEFEAEVEEIKKALAKEISPMVTKEKKEEILKEKLRALVNYSTPKGYSILTGAVIREIDQDILKALVQIGGDLNLATADGSTPLVTAIVSANTENSEVLLKLGADVNVVGNDGVGHTVSPLIAAVSAVYPSEELVDSLLEKNPDLTYKDDNGETALDHARLGRETAIEQRLLKKMGVIPKEPAPSRKSQAAISEDFSSVESEASESTRDEEESKDSEQKRNVEFLNEKKKEAKRIVGYRPLREVLDQQSSRFINDNILKAGDLLNELSTWREGRELSLDQQQSYEAITNDLTNYIENGDKKIESRKLFDPILAECNDMIRKLEKDHKVYVGLLRGEYSDLVRRVNKFAPHTSQDPSIVFRDKLKAMLAKESEKKGLKDLEKEQEMLSKVKTEFRERWEESRKLLGTNLKGKSVTEVSQFRDKVESFRHELEEWKKELPPSSFNPRMHERFENKLNDLKSLQQFVEKHLQEVQKIQPTTQDQPPQRPSVMTEYQKALKNIIDLASQIKNVTVKEKQTNLNAGLKEVTSNFEYQRWVASDKELHKTPTDREKVFVAIHKLDGLLKRAEKATKLVEEAKMVPAGKKVPGVSRAWERYCKGEVRRQLEKMAKEPLKSALDEFLEADKKTTHEKGRPVSKK